MKGENLGKKGKVEKEKEGKRRGLLFMGRGGEIERKHKKKWSIKALHKSCGGGELFRLYWKKLKREGRRTVAPEDLKPTKGNRGKHDREEKQYSGS